MGRLSFNVLDRLLRRSIEEHRAVIGWPNHERPIRFDDGGPNNYTRQFLGILHGLEAAPPVPSLSRFHVVFAGGLWTRQLSEMGFPPYRHSLDHMEKCGATTLFLDKLDTRASMEANARFIVDTVLQSSEVHPKRRLVLIGHSKGGIDMMAAISQSKKLSDRTFCLITIQSPLAGCVFAEAYMHNRPSARVIRCVLRPIAGMERAAIHDMCYGPRMSWIKERDLRDISSRCLCFCSDAVEEKGHGVLTTLSQYAHDRHGLEGDGLVFKDDAVIPEAAYVHIRPYTHFGFFESPSPSWGTLLTTLVLLASQIFD